MAAVPLALALGAALGWSLCDLARRFLVARMSAWSLVVCVTVGALPLVAIWGVLAGDWRLASGYALPGLGSTALNVVANFAFFRALQLSPLSVTLPMLSLTPVFSALFGATILGEELPARSWVGVAAVVGGAFLLATRTDGAAARRRGGVELGSVLMGGVALCWSATLLLDKLALGRASAPVHALVLHGGVAVAGLLALAGSGRLSQLGPARVNAGLLTAAVASGATALAAQLYAIQVLPIGLVETLKRGVGGSLAVVWGRAFFGEPVTAGKLAAILMLAAGVALVLL